MGQANPVHIAQEAIKYARDHGHDMVFLDTAGRLHVDEALMNELKNIKATVHPNEILLVLDAMTGQDAVNAATAFDEALGIDGVMLTKLDGDARGGAALSIRAATGKPIKFVGTGEKLDMIELFHPDRMASRILGMGDMLTFIEKAEQQYDEEQAAEAGGKAQEEPPDSDGLLWSRWTSCKNMGNLGQLAGMLPGDMGKQLDAANLDEKQLGRTRGHHPVHDPSGAGEPLHPQCQPQKAHCRRLRLAGVGCEPAAEVLRDAPAAHQVHFQGPLRRLRGTRRHAYPGQGQKRQAPGLRSEKTFEISAQAFI